MAKSIKSKWRRKMRNEKRKKFGKKELERLKTVVQKSEESGDTETKGLYTVKTPEEIKKMPGKEYNPKTMRDEHGTFPVWLHPRKRRRIVNRLKKQNKRDKSNKNSQKGKKK